MATSQERPRVASSTAPATWRLAAGALVLASAAPQCFASMQRWVWAADDWSRADRLVEDSLFDYSFPADPWENLGAAAQTFGVAYVLLALGVLAIGRATLERRRVQIAAGYIAAACFGITGFHALVSGLLGIPTFLQHLPFWTVLALSEVVAVLLLAVRAVRSTPATSLAWFLLIGATFFGYVLAAFVIAPAIIGYRTFDMTPHTETVVAAFTGAAGLALLLPLVPRSKRRKATN